MSADVDWNGSKKVEALFWWYYRCTRVCEIKRRPTHPLPVVRYSTSSSRSTKRKYVALTIRAWNWPSASDFGVGFMEISFPYAWYLSVAGSQKFSSSVRVGIFKFHV